MAPRRCLHGRTLLEWAMQEWEEPSAGHLLASLRRQACHGDANEMNILVGGGGAGRDDGGTDRRHDSVKSSLRQRGILSAPPSLPFVPFRCCRNQCKLFFPPHRLTRPARL